MCRMTDNHIRAKPVIIWPGRYMVARARDGKLMYLSGEGPVDVAAFKVLYAVRVKAKHNRPVPKYSRESMQGQNYHRPEWADLYRA